MQGETPEESKTISYEIVLDKAPGKEWDSEEGFFIPDLPLSRVEIWQQNPRKQFDADSLAELAESIRAVGVQQPIVVRKIEPVATTPLSGRGLAPRYSVIMGERRYRAALLAALTTIPALVRVGISDSQALELALVENLHRSDLNAIEEANGYAAMQALGLRQTAIAEKLHRSQGEIGNKLRLLKLPEEVQQLVITGKLSPTHARAILRFDTFPEVMSKIAELAVQEGATAKFLEDGVPYSNHLVGAKLIVQIQPWQAAFDVEETCVQGCPFAAYRKSTYGGHFCLKPEHYEVLQAEAEIEKKARIEAAHAELLRRQDAAKIEAKPASPPPPLDSRAIGDNELWRNAFPAAPEAETAESETPPVTSSAVAPPVPAAPMLHVNDLHYKEFERLDYMAAPPEGCTDACPCRAQALNSAGTMVPICLDPKRLQQFKAAQTRVEQKARKEVFAALSKEVLESLPSAPDADALALLLWQTIFGQAVELRRAVAERFPERVKEMLNKSYWGSHDTKLEDYDALAELGCAGVQNLALELTLAAERKSAIEQRSSRLPEHDRWFRRSVIVSDRDAREPVAATAETAAPEEDQEDEERLEYCLRCDEEIPKHALGSAVVEKTVFREGAANELRLLKLESGILVREGDDWDCYCAACAPEVKVCRKCGWTEEVGCAEGCYWVEDDLCSVCADEVKTEAESSRKTFCCACAREVSAEERRGHILTETIGKRLDENPLRPGARIHA